MYTNLNRWGFRTSKLQPMIYKLWHWSMWCLSSRSKKTKIEDKKKSKQANFRATPAAPSKWNPYTSQQIEQLKKVILDEKKATRCLTWVLLFHQDANCTNTETYCFFCGHPGIRRMNIKNYKENWVYFWY